jgi:hypothetical protein
MLSLAPTSPCGCGKPAGQRTPAGSAAFSPRIIRSWAAAGTRVGAILGAISGALILVTTPFAVIGAVVGAVVGSVYGLAAGILNGLVLTGLARAGVTIDNHEGRADAATAITTALTAYLGLSFIFGSVRGLVPWFLLIGVPALAAALVAVWLSHRLPTGPVSL